MKCPNCQAENQPDSRFCHVCATPLTEAAQAARVGHGTPFEIKRGEMFAGRYEIIEDLGSGGMGKVLKVFDHKINEVVALKLIRPEIGVNARAIERFKNELRFARRISHRYICRMYDLGEAGFYHYITMEYVSGEDLKRFIRRAGPLTAAKTVTIVRQVAEGLAEAHRLGVVHRDLKPQNIMIDQDGNARIMDFGIARFVDTDSMTGSGVLIGTPEYMAPEQSELSDVDNRADLYALGAVMYEMVTATVPFEGATPLSVIMKHKTDKPRDVREINAQVPAALAQVIAVCLEKDPDRRYRNAEELIAALDEVQASLGTTERLAAKPARKTAPVAKDAGAAGPGLPKALRWAVPAAGALLVGIAAWLVIFRGNAGPSGAASASPRPPTKAANRAAPRAGGERNPAATRPGTASPVEAASGNAAAGSQAVPSPAVNPANGGSKTAPAVAPKKNPANGGASKAAVRKESPKPAPAAPSSPPAASTPSSKAESRAPGPIGDPAAATLALARTTAARSLAEKEKTPPGDFFWVAAEARREEGRKALDRQDYAAARLQFAVSEKLFQVSGIRRKDDVRIRDLAKYVEGLRQKLDPALFDDRTRKAYVAAGEKALQAEAFTAKGDHENAIAALAAAAMDYLRLM